MFSSFFNEILFFLFLASHVGRPKDDQVGRGPDPSHARMHVEREREKLWRRHGDAVCFRAASLSLSLEIINDESLYQHPPLSNSKTPSSVGGDVASSSWANGVRCLWVFAQVKVG